METIQSKCCTKCGVEKPLTNEFFKERKFTSGNIGFRGECKECHNKIAATRYTNRVKKDKKIVLQKKCDKCSEIKDNTFFHKNSGRIDGLSVYCKDCSNEYKRTDKWRELDNERTKRRWATPEYKEYQKDYKEKNIIKIRKQLNAYHSKKRKEDNLYKIRTSVSRRINHIIKGAKTQPTLKILGADRDTIIKHFESLFSNGMTWENYGPKGWHIDHFYPISKAKTEEEIYKLNHYTNLRPLWWQDNLKKSDKISEEWGNA